MQSYPGIKNTCSQCGKALPGDVAYAENRDDAVAGRGVCVDCVSASEVENVRIIIAEQAHPEKIIVPEGAVVVNVSDGVDDAEASVSGKALRRRRKPTGGTK